MEFVDSLKMFFTNILDLSAFLSFFFLSLGLSIHAAPKKIEKKDILRLVLIFFGTYAVFIVFGALMFSLNNLIVGNNSGGQAFIYSLSIPIIVLTFSLIFDKGYKLHKFIRLLILFSVALILDVLSKNISWLFAFEPGALNFWFLLCRALPYILFPGMCFLLYKININHYRNLLIEAVIIIISLCALLIVISVQEYLISRSDNDFNILLSVSDVILVILLGFSYYMAYRIVEARHQITNMEVQKILAEAERTSILVNRVNMEELEKIKHDIKNQYSYLSILIKEGKNDEAVKYIDELIEQNSQVLNAFTCSNDVINSIINLELTKAKIKDIPIDVKAVVPPKLPFKTNDLVCLITNAVDNAIENYYSENNTPITVRIMKQNDFIRFIVSNPVNLENINPNNLITTKKKGRGHGYGTKIIKNVARTYNGFADFNVEKELFVCDVVLNLNIEEKPANV